MKNLTKKYYRGCPSNSTNNLLPSAYRFISGDEALAYESSVFRKVKTNINNYELLRDKYLKASPEKKGKFWALLQHYGFPTRLLDVTEDKDIAKYFACSSDFGQEGIIYTFSEYDNEFKYLKNADDAKNVTDKMDLVENPQEYIGRNVREIKEERNKNSQLESTLSKNIVFSYEAVFGKSIRNQRCENQAGAFIIPGNIIDKGRITNRLNEIIVKDRETINADKKMNILVELCEKGIDYRFIYPDSEQTIRMESILWKFIENGNYEITTGDLKYINPDFNGCEMSDEIKRFLNTHKSHLERLIAIVAVDYVNYCNCLGKRDTKHKKLEKPDFFFKRLVEFA